MPVGLYGVVAEYAREGDYAEGHPGVRERGDLPLPVPVESGVAALELRYRGGVVLGGRGQLLAHRELHHVLYGLLRFLLVEHHLAGVGREDFTAELSVEGVEDTPRYRAVYRRESDPLLPRDLLSLLEGVNDRISAFDRLEIPVLLQQPGLLGDVGVVEHHLRVGVERDGEDLTLVLGALQNLRQELVRTDVVLREHLRVEGLQKARRRVGAKPGLVQNRDLRRAPADRRHGELGVVRSTPRQRRRFQL